MKYFVEIEGQTIEVDLTGAQPLVGGRPVEAELAAIPGSSLRSLLVDGRSFALHARQGEARGEWDLHLDGLRLEAVAVDERTRAIRAMTAAASGPQGPRPVRAPMPGLVVRVEVEAGQEVRAGQGVAIIEAMKMENELKAEAAGVVTRVHVAAGQAVEKGALLIEFEAGTASETA